MWAPSPGIAFFGPSSKFIIGGSQFGNLIVWDKNSQEIVCRRSLNTTGNRTIGEIVVHP